MHESDVREQVRQRYAAAAVAVTTGGVNPLTLVEADQCCAPSNVIDANESCCGGGEVDTQELLDLEREPLRLRGAGGVTATRRGAGFSLERMNSAVLSCSW